MPAQTILIVEDRRENIVHLANNILKPNGYQVLTAMDGQRGLKRILSDRPDLVIMDLNMPKMDGLEVLAALQERGDPTPVILTTFYGSEHVAQQAIRLGAVDYVVKPYHIETMLAAIRKAVAVREVTPLPPQTSPRQTDGHAPERAMPLTRQVERWMRDMNILTRVGKALVAVLELDRIVMRTVEAAIYITRADYAFLYLEDPADGHLHLRGARGPQDPRAHVLDRLVERGLAVEVATAGETAIRTKAPADVVLFDVAGQALGPMIAAPLHWQSSRIGVLVAARSQEEAPFVEYDTEWLSGLADYAAIAVENALAFQRPKPQATPSPISAQDMAVLHSRLVEAVRQLATVAEALANVIEQLPRDAQEQ